MSDSLPPHLKSCTQCGAELPAGGTNGLCPACLMAEAMKPSGPKTRWEPPTAEELAKLLPQYEITRMLGRGGMGAVYQGTQKSLDRAVAIKILSNDLEEADASFAERFKNEARAMAKLSHPGIVAVFDSGETANGLLYIVMEFIEGTDVARMIAKDKRLHTDHAMAITAHVCDALAYAHERGIIHRDIKPANIMVGYDGVVKVADFGLAKMSKAGESALTQSGMAMGTLHFMAPEALMLGTAVDHRADIYAVGVMLYQMLTGKLPQGMFELPSLQVPGLDPRYDSIIGKALREDRELRYPRVLDMRHDLDAILTQPVVKVEAAAEKAPAALQTQARPQRPGGQPYRPPQPQVVVRTEKKGSPLLWVGFIVMACIAAWLGLKKSGGESTPEPGGAAGPPAAWSGPSVTTPPNAALGGPSSLPSTASPASATKEAPFVNSLGMKFVPVPGTNVLMCMHETRKSDYAAFAAETPGTDRSWVNPTFVNPTFEGMKVSEGDDHPVVSVNSLDAEAFCQWLSKKEGRSYRLPSWREWGWAVGTGPLEHEGATFAEMKVKVAGIYPWGRGWPPPKGAGNMADEALKARQPTAKIIAGYQDGYATTAPVMSFPPNEIGIYDLCGNVNEWCGDITTKGDQRKIRSSSWVTFGPDVSALSSNPGDGGQSLMLRCADLGFRVVLELTSGTASAETAATATPPSTPAKATAIETTKAPPMTTAKPAAVVVKESVPLTLPTGPTTWTDTKGRIITATFKAIASGNVLLDIAGKVTPVPLNTLSAASQKLARDYQQQAASTTSPDSATKDRPFANTLGMKFVPVPETKVLFCIHEARYKDWLAYTTTNGLGEPAKSYMAPVGDWITERDEDHPVKNATHDDAVKFCQWLSKKEGKTYRLPTDQEWSYAVGIGQEESWTSGATPESRNEKLKDVFPWGTTWPPLQDAGNFADTAWTETFPKETRFIDGYSDGFPTTAPVMSFKPNSLGIYDLSGNVGEWVADWWNPAQKDRTIRGSAFVSSERQRLFSSARGHLPPSVFYQNANIGIRVVLEVAPTAATPLTSPPAVVQPVPRIPASQAATILTSATKDQPFTNSLGMKFVPVPNTDVLFCIHETRRQDFATYAEVVAGVDRSWMEQQENGVACGAGSAHPVVGVSWEEAGRFCEWLSQKEGRRYRLPTDREWSWAADIGQQEQSSQATVPEILNGKLTTVFPWGGEYPPVAKDAGNYADSAWYEKFPTRPWIENFSDGFPTTAPVMSFRSSKLGLYDLGGNVWEFVQDWWNPQQQGRVIRGGSFNNVHQDLLLSSGRFRCHPTDRFNNHGFRIVLELPKP
ncbi:bifunctional serine/threonine-protein kinase/formylglycine-generating enzyme family protein [Prosthecobacter sp.]|uniref:bifunctional serine/threonine-protein kinase/formylglycine-generating enzyme family protein n=1 Tax=Prosthecobacter sp. TaxID=1965333 RepID=UPI002AB8346A|nr:bifunctional serine/threonine-protein kinase/formylglycine-generating enzyme family protein [Prosthecobacter sp.]MDZ4405157.1 bifunctional serine/threonine-protein kinase/formylglycine-generating enzyme family protein [Prosthecobacter sp.]